MQYLFSQVHIVKKKKDKSRLTVYLTDAPAEYDAVNIEVVGIQVKASTDPGEGGWTTMPMPVSPVIYNLLEFTNGMETLLSTFELPAGKVSQLRLKLGENNFNCGEWCCIGFTIRSSFRIRIRIKI